MAARQQVCYGCASAREASQPPKLCRMSGVWPWPLAARPRGTRETRDATPTHCLQAPSGGRRKRKPQAVRKPLPGHRARGALALARARWVAGWLGAEWVVGVGCTSDASGVGPKTQEWVREEAVWIGEEDVAVVDCRRGSGGSE